MMIYIKEEKKNMKKIVVVNGYPSSGKTEFELFVTKHIPTIIYSSIDPVKYYAKQYFGWNDEKTETWRRFLSDFKKFLVEEFDLIFNEVNNRVNTFYISENEIMMIDSREPKEIERFKKAFKAKTLFIKNDRVEKIISNNSDANVENYKYDYIIENNGTLEELEQKAINFIKELN